MSSPLITNYQEELANLETIQDRIFVIGATDPAKNLDTILQIAIYAEGYVKKLTDEYPDLRAIAANIGYNAFRLVETYSNRITEAKAQDFKKQRNAMWSVVKQHDEASKSRQQG